MEIPFTSSAMGTPIAVPYVADSEIDVEVRMRNVFKLIEFSLAAALAVGVPSVTFASVICSNLSGLAYENCERRVAATPASSVAGCHYSETAMALCTRAFRELHISAADVLEAEVHGTESPNPQVVFAKLRNGGEILQWSSPDAQPGRH